ncbi:MAG: hypothetical protein MJE77_43740 [Proteobacteria bacterium]|nr:hypothetical protein [Pseudomonadota bacterium]
MIEALCSQLPATFCEIDELAAILLRFCRERAEYLRLAYDSDLICRLMYEESDDMQRWLERTLDEDWLDDGDLEAVRGFLRRAASEIADHIAAHDADVVAAVVSARAFAEALDRSHGPRFASVFRGRGTTEVKAGDPIPIPHPPLKELFADDLGTNPMRLGPKFYELRWLRLLPDVARGHQVRLDFRSVDLLANIRHDAPIAIGIPCDLDDLRIERSDEPTPRFLSVHPYRPEEQKKILLDFLEQAQARGARMVLFPELSLDEECLEAVKQWHARTDHQIAIAVCGSVHTRRHGERRNVSTTLLQDGTEVEHFKFNPFYVSVPSAKTGRPINYREDIVTIPAIITINMCGEWSFTTLICKDLLEPGVAEILEQARVSLILVPACSPKTAVFEQIAGALAARAQALVVIGNLAASSSIDPSSVIIARPIHTGTIETVRRSEITPPYLHFSVFMSRHLDE